jgi:hypothetical protein
MQQKQDIFDFIIERPRLSIITGLFFILMGILVSDLPKMAASLQWDTTEGTVVSHQIQAKRFREYDGDVYEEINVFIHYEYTVGGITFTSQSINARNILFYPPEIAEQYPVHKKVIVYYNPKDPAEALLEPGFVDVLKAFNVFSFLIFCTGIYFIFIGISGSKKSKKNADRFRLGWDDLISNESAEAETKGQLMMF